MDHRPNEKRRIASAASSDQSGQFSSQADVILDLADELAKMVKVKSTLAAKTALAGGRLCELASGNFIIEAVGFMRFFADLDAVADFVNRLDSRSRL